MVAPFEWTFTEKEKIPRETLDTILCTPEELSGVLNRALEVIERVRANGYTESEKCRKPGKSSGPPPTRYRSG